MRDLARNGIINKAQVRAQMYEEEIITLARDMAFMPDMSHADRMTYMRFVMDYARGKPMEFIVSRETVDLSVTNVANGNTIGQTIEAVRVNTALMNQLDALVRQGVPFADWPEDIRQMSEAAAFADD
jgi:hypothetical protein